MIQHVSDSMHYKRKILVVDDEPVNRQLLSFILEESDSYEIETAADGREALRALSAAPEAWSLVCLDLLMPVLDGFGVLDAMRVDPALSRIPIIVLTSEIELEVESLRRGAADFIKKPFDAPEIILARVRRIIELNEDRHMLDIAEHDETGLYTQKFFLEYMDQICRRKGPQQMDTIALDIDHFHLINEIYGKDFSDYVLKQIGEGVRAFLEAHTGIGCHWDTDQFYIYCEHLEDTSALHDLKQRIAALSQDARLRIRAGIYTDTPEEDIGADRRLSSARFACNTLRDVYDRNIAVYDAALHDNQLFAHRLVNDMERGIRNGEFRIWLQPKFRITDDTPVLDSAEVLVRWEHPQFGQLSPSRFIPVFEQNGLLRELDRTIWGETASLLRHWHDTLGKDPDISINVSRIDLYDESTEGFLTQVLTECGIDPKHFRLEITESASTEDTDSLITVLEHMSERGFIIEMDDFGAGYSSLNMLTDMPLSAVKLDMLFARNIDNDPKKYYMVELIISLARYLGLSVIAEGVETEAQYRKLKDAGVDICQGYYFSKPLPAEEFERRYLC